MGLVPVAFSVITLLSAYTLDSLYVSVTTQETSGREGGTVFAGFKHWVTTTFPAFFCTREQQVGPPASTSSATLGQMYGMPRLGTEGNIGNYPSWLSCMVGVKV